MTTAIELLKQLASSFEDVARANGSMFVRLKDGRPEWMSETVRKCHDDMLPDDTRYRMIWAVVGELADRTDDIQTEEGEIDEHGAMGDVVHDVLDSLVDVYTARLTEWVASHLDRVGYCTAAAEDLGAETTDMIASLQRGQYYEYEQILWSLVRELNEMHDADAESEG
jgi:hypothetical protein